MYDTPGVVVTAGSLDDLASAMRVPVANLRATVSRYNELTVQGVDLDFPAFGEKTVPKPRPIDTPPFYAAQFFPLTRKSMGGIDIDTDCRVLDRSGRAIPGLFAVGEVTGFGGINGKAAFEGTFLGPGIYMGRIAGRRIAQTLARTCAATIRSGGRQVADVRAPRRVVVAHLRRDLHPFVGQPDDLTCRRVDGVTRRLRKPAPQDCLDVFSLDHHDDPRGRCGWSRAHCHTRCTRV
jgi:succinate dehydrogenase/fumarate reductase flavoprotein subunit